MAKRSKQNSEPLPIRSSSQIKEDESKGIFISIIKPWMVVSWIEKDFGIDAIIEITKPIASSKNQIVTGKRISVQLKSSTSTKFDKKDFSLSVPKEKINYWVQAFEPVIIVYIDLNLKTAYYRWIDDKLVQELNSRDDEWIAHDSVSIKFDSKLQVNSTTLNAIEKYALAWKRQSKTILTPGNYFSYSKEAFEYSSKLKELTTRYSIDALSLEVDGLTKDVFNSIYTIAIIGLSRVGKSTLINALLEREISPMGKLPTTGVPITIFPKNENKAYITFKDGKTIEGDASSTFLTEYTAQDRNPQNIKGVKLVRVHLINTLLERGFALCDVPGLDDADTEIKKIAKTAIINSNAIVYVISIAGYNEGEFRINDQNINDLTELRGKMDRVFLVFNKIDSISKEDQVHVKKYIDNTLAQFGIIEFLAAPPIYISSREAFDNRMKKKAGTDSVTQLEQILWEFLINQNRTGLHKLLSNFANQIELIEKLKTLIKIRLENTNIRIGKESEIKSVQTEINNLVNFINQKRDEIYREINVYVVDRFNNVLYHMENELTGISSSQQIPNKEQISSYLENEAYKILSDVYEYLQKESYQLQIDVNNWVGEKLRQVELSLDDITENQELKLPEISIYTGQVYSFFIENHDGYIGIMENIVSGIGRALEWLFNNIFDLLTSDVKIKTREINKIVKNSKKSYNQIQVQLLNNVSNYLNGICKNILDKTQDRTRVYLGELVTEINKLDTPLTENERNNYTQFKTELQSLEQNIASQYNHLKDYTDGIDVFKK